MKAPGREKRVRYALIGAGHIAQNAVVPAFKHATENSVLTALFSGDPKKRRVLGRTLHIEHVHPYEAFERACREDLFDAVYIALPNTMHRRFTERAAAAGKHILCEKPMATTPGDCRAMIDAAAAADVRLMVAYRLHFERANMDAVAMARKGKLGEIRLFNSCFTMQVRAKNIRTEGDKGGGPLFDIGIYCINAARYMLGANPLDVVASGVSGDDHRFADIEEAVSAVMRFPGDRLASFTCSFGAAATGYFQVVGTKGDLCLDPAYEYSEPAESSITINDKTKTRKYRLADHFAPELIYFSDCVLKGAEPEPGGVEGLIDVQIINAIFESMKTGRRVKLDLPNDRKPGPHQVMRKPPPRRKRLVHVKPGHRG